MILALLGFAIFVLGVVLMAASAVALYEDRHAPEFDPQDQPRLPL